MPTCLFRSGDHAIFVRYWHNLDLVTFLRFCFTKFYYRLCNLLSLQSVPLKRAHTPKHPSAGDVANLAGSIRSGSSVANSRPAKSELSDL
jgi:hypothetical protein